MAVIWNINLIALLFAVVMAAISQILLKYSAGKAKDSIVLEYLNIEVISAYSMLLGSTLLVIFALQKIEFKDVSIINSFGQVLVLVLSWRLLDEKITISKLSGILLIIIGMGIYFA